MRNGSKWAGFFWGTGLLLLVLGCDGVVRPLPLGWEPSFQRLEALGVSRLMVVGSASLEAATRHPEWFPKAESFGGKSALRMFARAAQDPALFRQLDRQIGFQAVWISGDSGTSGPLFEGLVSDPDWKPSYVDHQGTVFQRASSAGGERLEVGPVGVSKLGRGEMARIKAAVAVNLSALRRRSEASSVLAEAKGMDPGEVDVRVAEARLDLDEGRWDEALATASSVLGLRRNYLPALSVKARALYSSGRFAEAFTFSRKLVERSAGDPLVLFSHAKIAHELRIFGEEIDTLKALIEAVDRDGGWSVGYRIYLGQAYAAIGDAELALKELDAAWADPGLSPDQKAFVGEALEKLRSR